MSSLPVLKNPNDGLRIVSTPVRPGDFVREDIQQLIANMKETMLKERGIGIAAPQVGVHQRVIIVDMDGTPSAFFNPKIISASDAIVESEEGCLSVPGVFGMVDRHKKVKVKAFSEQGEPIRLSLNGLEAIVFQHEIDHLDGILFIDKVTRYTNPPEGSVQI